MAKDKPTDGPITVLSQKYMIKLGFDPPTKL